MKKILKKEKVYVYLNKKEEINLVRLLKSAIKNVESLMIIYERSTTMQFVFVENCFRYVSNNDI